MTAGHGVGNGACLPQVLGLVALSFLTALTILISRVVDAQLSTKGPVSPGGADMLHGNAEGGAVGALEEWVKCWRDLSGTGSEKQNWRSANCDAPWRHRAGAASASFGSAAARNGSSRSSITTLNGSRRRFLAGVFSPFACDMAALPQCGL